MQNHKNFFALFLAMFMLVMTIMSHDVVTSNVHHHCSGEECSICILIDTVAKNLSVINYVYSGILSVILLCAFAHVCTIFEKYICVRNTLVLLNVELLN